LAGRNSLAASQQAARDIVAALRTRAKQLNVGTESAVRAIAANLTGAATADSSLVRFNNSFPRFVEQVDSATAFS